VVEVVVVIHDQLPPLDHLIFTGRPECHPGQTRLEVRESMQRLGKNSRASKGSPSAIRRADRSFAHYRGTVIGCGVGALQIRWPR
jgi:hypothetical protein